MRYYISPCCGNSAPDFATATEAVRDWVDNLAADYDIDQDAVDDADIASDAEPEERLAALMRTLALPCAGHRDEGCSDGRFTATLATCDE